MVARRAAARAAGHRRTDGPNDLHAVRWTACCVDLSQSPCPQSETPPLRPGIAQRGWTVLLHAHELRRHCAETCPIHRLCVHHRSRTAREIRCGPTCHPWSCRPARWHQRRGETSPSRHGLHPRRLRPYDTRTTNFTYCTLLRLLPKCDELKCTQLCTH